MKKKKIKVNYKKLIISITMLLSFIYIAIDNIKLSAEYKEFCERERLPINRESKKDFYEYKNIYNFDI